MEWTINLNGFWGENVKTKNSLRLEKIVKET